MLSISTLMIWEIISYINPYSNILHFRICEIINLFQLISIMLNLWNCWSPSSLIINQDRNFSYVTKNYFLNKWKYIILYLLNNSYRNIGTNWYSLYMLFYVLVLLLESMKIIIANNSEFCLFIILSFS